MSSVYLPTLTATTDATGAATFVLDPPTGSNLYVSAMISILGTGGAGDFYAQVGAGKKYGGWSGSSPFGPVTYQGNQRLTIVATGLSPATTYTCEIYANVGTQDELGDALPTATGQGSRGAGASATAINKSAINLAGSQTFQWFPVGTWAGYRLTVDMSGNAKGGGPVQVDLQWFNSTLDRRLGRRTYMVGDSFTPAQEGFKLDVTGPNLGPNLRVVISLGAYGSGAAVLDLALELTSIDAATYALDTPTQGQVHTELGIIANMQYPLTAGNGVNFLWANVFEGNAILDFSPFDAAAGVNMSYILRVNQIDASNGVVTIMQRSSAAGDAGRQTGMLWIPPRPTSLFIQNLDGVSRHFDITMELDRDRVGG